MRRVFLCIAFALTASGVAAGCNGGGGGGSSAPCNPAGTWDIEITYGSGTCGFSGLIAEDDLTVTETTASTWTIADSTGKTVTGTITTSGDRCLLSAVESGNFSNGDSYTENRQYTLINVAITGSGSIIDTTKSCTQQFAVTTGIFTPD